LIGLLLVRNISVIIYQGVRLVIRAETLVPVKGIICLIVDANGDRPERIPARPVRLMLRLDVKSRPAVPSYCDWPADIWIPGVMDISDDLNRPSPAGLRSILPRSAPTELNAPPAPAVRAVPPILLRSNKMAASGLGICATRLPDSKIAHTSAGIYSLDLIKEKIPI
jgi:hypothetical protein